MIKRLCFMFLLVLALSQPVKAAGDGQGKIEGGLANGTSGGSSVAGQGLTLKIFTGDNETGSINTVSDNSGRFEFGGLNTDPAYRYQITLTYQAAEYIGPFLSFSGEPVITTTMDVYDTTTDGSVVSVEESHLVILPGSGSFLVEEYLVFTNSSDRAFIGSTPVTPDGKKETLRFSLPPGAVHFQAELGLIDSRIVQGESGISDTMPLLPGTREVIYSYLVGYDSKAYALQHQVNYPTNVFNLLVQGQDTLVSVESLTRQTPLDMNGTIYQYFTGQGLAAGDTLEVSLSGQPAGPANRERPLVWLVVALVLMLAAGGGYLILRKRLSPAKAPLVSGETAQEKLLGLAQLDDDFEDGKITEEVYQKLRSEKKRQLAEMLKASKDKPGL
ncbi:MAG: hypothetical protein V1823_04055 [Chloroflexota bacterium]